MYIIHFTAKMDFHNNPSYHTRSDYVAIIGYKSATFETSHRQLQFQAETCNLAFGGVILKRRSQSFSYNFWELSSLLSHQLMVRWFCFLLIAFTQIGKDCCQNCFWDILRWNTCNVLKGIFEVSIKQTEIHVLFQFENLCLFSDQYLKNILMFSIYNGKIIIFFFHSTTWSTNSNLQNIWINNIFMNSFIRLMYAKYFFMRFYKSMVHITIL